METNLNKTSNLRTSTGQGPQCRAGVPEDERQPRKVRVSVRYCRFSNYKGVAERLERALREEFPNGVLEVELVPARGGVYEVTVDDRLVFSKRATYRLPDPEEIAYHVRTALGRQPAYGAMVPPSG